MVSELPMLSQQRDMDTCISPTKRRTRKEEKRQQNGFEEGWSKYFGKFRLGVVATSGEVVGDFTSRKNEVRLLSWRTRKTRATHGFMDQRQDPGGEKLWMYCRSKCAEG